MQETNQQVGEELRCPLCGYDLRGITEPRCPECGYAFEWDELRDPARRLHPYLFEHHPHRPVWSFVRTLLGGLLPWRFWGKLHPTQPLRPRRMILYWLIVLAIASVPVATAFCAVVIVEKSEIPKWRDSMKNRLPSYAKPMDDATLDRLYPEFPTPRFFVIALGDVGASSTWLVLAAAWPWLTLLSFLVLRTSMRRARIGVSHVMRCSIYSGDVFVWGALLLIPSSVAMLLAGLRMNIIALFGAQPRFYIGMALLVLGLMMVWRLFAAYRRYLRMPHALAMAVLLQVMVWLLMVWIVAVFNVVVGRRY